MRFNGTSIIKEVPFLVVFYPILFCTTHNAYIFIKVYNSVID